MTRLQKTHDNSKLNKLLASMDRSVADTFSYRQRKALRASLNNQEWGKHKVDFRPTLAVPLFPWSFYLVFLAGVNKRGVTKAERLISCLMVLFILFLAGLIIVTCAFLVIYLAKSWLGIDLFPNESLGIWDQVKGSL